MLDELTRFPLAEPGLSEQVRALADELCAIAARAGEVDRYLSSIDVDALRERVVARGSSSDARAEQLTVVEGLVRRRAELDGELEHVEAALGAIHAQLVAAHAAEARPDTLAGEVNDLRTRMRVLSESLAEAYEHRAPGFPAGLADGHDPPLRRVPAHRRWSEASSAASIPGLQLEQAVSEARRQDVELRTQAARVIALRTEIELRLDRAVDDREKLHDHAAEALREADAAARRGDAATAEKMTRGARAAAVRLEAADATVEGLKTAVRRGPRQAEQAKLAVEENALELERLSARRLELVSKLEQAKLQEQVNRAVDGLRRPVDSGAPTLDDIELRIEKRMALASAAAELESASPEGQRREVERSLTELAADRRLSQMREELGLRQLPSRRRSRQARTIPARRPGVRVALAQLDLTVGALRENRARIADACAEAARQGADIVIAPELALSGYPPEDLVLRPSFLAACARELDALAAEAAAPLLVGVPVLDGDRPRNSAALCVGGEVVARYDKRELPNYGVFDETRTFAAGRRPLALDVAGALVAVTICEDVWLPGPSEAAASAGATVIANLSASPYHLGKGEAREQMLRTRARDGRRVRRVLQHRRRAGRADLRRPQLRDRPGRARCMARAASFAEELLVCDIDPTMAIAARLRDARLRHGRRRPPKRLEPVASVAAPAGCAHARGSATRIAEPPAAPDDELWAALRLGLRDYVQQERVLAAC